MIAPPEEWQPSRSLAHEQAQPIEKATIESPAAPSPQLRLMKALNRLWSQLGSSGDLPRILEPVVKSMRQAVSADAIQLWLGDSSTQPAKLTIAVADQEVQSPAQKLLAEEDEIRKIAHQRRPAFWKAPRNTGQDGQSPGSGGICGLPLQVGRTVLGVLLVQFIDFPPTSVLRALASSADDLARAIQHHQEFMRLKSAEQSLTSLTDASSDTIVELDLQHQVVSWNPAAARAFGIKSKSVFDPRRLTQRSDTERLIQSIETARCGSTVSQQELTLIQCDGSKSRALVTAKPMSGTAGVVDRIQLVFHDCTATRSEERCTAFLKDSRTLLSRASTAEDAANQFIGTLCRHFGWAAGEFWQLSTEDNCFEQATHWSAPGVAAESFLAAARPFRADELPPAIQSMWTTPGIWRWSDYGFCNEDSRTKLAATSGLHDALIISLGLPGEPVIAAVVLYAFEIDEPDARTRNALATGAFEFRQQMEIWEAKKTLCNVQQTLFQDHKLDILGAMVSGVAHDFNNLLMVVMCSTDLLQQLYGANPEQLELLQDIRDAGERARVLTAQILSFVRQRQRTVSNININTVIRDLDRMIQRLVGFNITLELDLAADLRQIAADPVEIQQLVLNLVVNARDSMPQGGRLRIATFNRTLSGRDAKACEGVDPGSYVCVAVIDTGSGIEPAVARRMFDPFFTTKPQGQGTGLGLSLVQSILERCRGNIAVDSEVGRGSTFSLFFPPARDAISPWVVNETCQPLPTGSETILLVEEDEAVRNVIQSMLAVRGYDVLEAASAEEAVRVFQQDRRRIALLVTELYLPGQGGRELARQFTRIKPKLPVLLLSAHIDEPVSPDRDCIPVLNKPFTIASLSVAIRRALDGQLEARKQMAD